MFFVFSLENQFKPVCPKVGNDEMEIVDLSASCDTRTIDHTMHHTDQAIDQLTEQTIDESTDLNQLSVSEALDQMTVPAAANAETDRKASKSSDATHSRPNQGQRSPMKKVAVSEINSRGQVQLQ